MFNLDNNWMTSEPLDFEYKTYMILDYEQKIKSKFSSYVLYPYFDDVLKKIHESKNFLTRKQEFNNEKKSIKKIDTVNYKLIYKSDISDDRIEIFEQIAEYALNKFKSCYVLGEQIFEDIYRSIKIFDLNLTLRKIGDVGTIILQMKNLIKIYKYHLTKFIDTNEIVYGINFEFLEERENSAKYIDMIRTTHHENVFLLKIERDVDFDSLLTITRKKMINYLSANIE